MPRLCTAMMLRPVRLTLPGALLLAATPLLAQDAAIAPVDAARVRAQEMIDRVVENQKKNEQALDIYERIEKVEVRKAGSDAQPLSVKISRVIPAGTGVGKIPVRPDGRAVDDAAYRAELGKIVKALTWAVEDGRAQREAYEKISKKKKEREVLIDATRRAFLYTFASEERRGDVLLSKYRMEPNPGFKRTFFHPPVPAHSREYHLHPRRRLEPRVRVGGRKFAATGARGRGCDRRYFGGAVPGEDLQRQPFHAGAV